MITETAKKSLKLSFSSDVGETHLLQGISTEKVNNFHFIVSTHMYIQKKTERKNILMRSIKTGVIFLQIL